MTTAADALLKRRLLKSRLMFALTALCTAASLSLLFAILGIIAWRGASSLSWAFLTRLPRPIGETGGGIANAIVGSAKIIGLACLMGLPVGVLGGVYLAEHGSGLLGRLIRFCADVLNGVPSIVMGMFAYGVLVVPMKRFSALAGSAALAAILVPVVLRNTEEFLRLVPGTLREAGLALGVPRWKVVLRVILPTASRGILTGALLGVARIAGETAPLIFTAFGSPYWDHGWLQPMASLPLTIFTYAISPYEDWHRQAWAAAFILVGLALAVNVVARLALKPAGGAAH